MTILDVNTTSLDSEPQLQKTSRGKSTQSILNIAPDSNVLPQWTEWRLFSSLHMPPI